ncbi:hypothetical protein QL285_013532 [Trifolium repens]|nr:hypothetical protein QL285_095756 [Trifolium repens]KAK2365637.1 hypothetical protein QL285_079113 [Trifolium repens]KAK2397829.1 hypothetical protein QL285_059367 [Trifolium repens]KAK2442329.1 hypothetical protein QL285_013532 [Trifolium repens]
MSQSPNSATSVNPTETHDSSPVITDATPITTIHPSFSSVLNPKPKKSTAKRPSTFKTPKSKKTKGSSSSASKKTSKKKGSNSKSKSIHTMQELYLDDVAEKNVESHVDGSEKSDSDLNAVAEGNPNVVDETLEIQKGITGDNTTVSDTVGEGIIPDSPEVEETLTDQVVKEVQNSLKDTTPKPNVAPDVTTSLAQDEPTPDIVGDAVNTEEQVDQEPVADETIVPQTEKELVADEEENTDIPTTDNDVSVDDDVVDVDAMDDLQQTVSEVAGGSIARRLRNRKGKDADVVVEVVAKVTPSKKKKVIGPSRKPSKVEIASEKKKKSGKRKQPEVGDSDYEVEEDVPHIVPNIVSSAKKTSQKKFRRAAIPELDVVHDVPNIVSTGKKKIGGRIIPQNVPDVPMDNISFHFIESAQKWKFVANRRLALERELSAEALEQKEIIALIEKAGLMKTVSGIGDCYEKLVKEFLVNIPEDCDNTLSKEYHKVYVRGKCVMFSPAIINKYLGNKEDGYAELEVTNNQVCKTITANQVKVWPMKGKVPSVMLSVKYAILNRIGTVNWVPTTHTSDIATSLARFVYAVGTGTEFNYGAHIFEETVQHAKSWAVRMPIAYPSLICGIILTQHPTIITADDEVSKRESPLDFHPRLFEGTHAADIEITGPSVAAPTGSGSMSRKEMIASLEAACRALDEKKKSLEQVIVALKQEEAAEEGEQVQVGQEGGDQSEDGGTEELELSDASADF